MHRVLVDGGGGVCEQNELGTNYTCSSILSQIQAHEVSGLARNSGKECPNLKSIFQNKSLISGEKNLHLHQKILLTIIIQSTISL